MCAANACLAKGNVEEAPPLGGARREPRARARPRPPPGPGVPPRTVAAGLAAVQATAPRPPARSTGDASGGQEGARERSAPGGQWQPPVYLSLEGSARTSRGSGSGVALLSAAADLAGAARRDRRAGSRSAGDDRDRARRLASCGGAGRRVAAAIAEHRLDGSDVGVRLGSPALRCAPITAGSTRPSTISVAAASCSRSSASSFPGIGHRRTFCSRTPRCGSPTSRRRGRCSRRPRAWRGGFLTPSSSTGGSPTPGRTWTGLPRRASAAPRR